MFLTCCTSASLCTLSFCHQNTNIIFSALLTLSFVFLWGGLLNSFSTTTLTKFVVWLRVCAACQSDSDMITIGIIWVHWFIDWMICRSGSSCTSRSQVKQQHINSHQSSVDIMSRFASCHTWLASFSAARSHRESSAGRRTVRGIQLVPLLPHLIVHLQLGWWMVKKTWKWCILRQYQKSRKWVAVTKDGKVFHILVADILESLWTETVVMIWCTSSMTYAATHLTVAQLLH